MKRIALVVLLVGLAAAVLFMSRRGRAPGPASAGSVVANVTSGTIAFQGSEYRIAGPFVHENLAVFVLHSRDHDETDFLTLDEGLKDGSVMVSEKAEGQVNELLVENRSKRPLFVQVGDRLRGGKQDRIVGASFVVPPLSGQQPIRSFCVEQGRWSPTTAGTMSFCATVSSAVAPQAVRAAALGADQGQVWSEVARSKEAASQTLKAPNGSSTLNETLDSAEVRSAQDRYSRALGALLEGRSDAVGIAFAVNGKVEEVDIYPGATLLRKLYPRLLESFALQVATRAAMPSVPLSAGDLERFLTEGQVTSSRTEELLGNQCGVRIFDRKVEAETKYGERRFIMATGK